MEAFIGKTLTGKALTGLISIFFLCGCSLIDGYATYEDNEREFSIYKVMLYALVSGTNFYVITCTSTTESYNADEETFNKIIKRFRFRI